MSKDNNVDQEQIQNVKEAVEFQNQVIREFVEDHAERHKNQRSIEESTARLPDNQNRMIKHNRQMG